MDLYCVKCKARTQTINETTTVTKNNRNALTGNCATCGTKIFRFIKKSDGDIVAKLSGLPGLPWDKYPGEKHLPGYSYCGPGTRLDIRLNKNNQTDPGEEPINAIDEACRIHDLAYLSDDLQQRHLADVNLIHAINAIPDKSIKEKVASAIIKKLL